MISLLVCIFAVAVGGTPVLLGVLLSRQGVADSAIGLSAAFSPLGIIASSFVIPRTAERFGAIRIAVGSCLVGLGAMLLMAWTPEPVVWIIARFFWGLAVGGFYIVNKAWLAQITPAGSRGRAFGIYISFLSAGFASGPLLVSLVDFESSLSFFILGAAFLASAVGVLLTSGKLPDFKSSSRAPVLAAFPLIPIALLAAASFGAFDHTTLAFLPKFGAIYGLSETAMGIGLSVLNVGNVVLQTPIGWASDRWGRRPVLVGCAVLTALGSLLLPMLISTQLVYPFFFLWGACAYGVTTVALAAISDRFTGPRLLSCSAAMTMVGGMGGVFGPPAVGLTQDLFGVGVFPVSIAMIFGVLATLAFLTRSCKQT